MAITKIHAIKSTLSKALAYIENPEKTDNQMLVSGYNVDPLMASVEFEMTAAMARELKGNYTKTGGSNNLAYHLIQSFSPQDNVTPEQAHEIGKQLADKFLEGKFEYVITTHIDKGHIHNHIIMNAVSFYDHKKLQTKPYKTAAQIRAISDNLCAENNLSVIRKGEKLGYSHTEYMERKRNNSWKAEIRKRLGFILKTAANYEEFVAAAAALGVTVDNSGKHIKYKYDSVDRWVRGKTLSDTDSFTGAGISARLEGNARAQRYLQESLLAAASKANTYEDFVSNLKNDHSISIVRRRSGRTFYKIDDMEGSQFDEGVLGSAYTSGAIKAAIEGQRGFFDNNTPYSITDDYFSKGKTKVEEKDTPIRLPEGIVDKVTPGGILLKLPEYGGQVYIDNAHIDLNEATGKYTAWLGSKYNYYFVKDQVDPDSPEAEQLSDKFVKGEDLLRHIDLLNGSRPQRIEIAAEDVLSIGEKGVTISMPDLGIKSIFVENQFVTLDRLNGGSCYVDLYESWNYSFRADQGNELRGITGAELIEKLRSRADSPVGQLSGRIAAYQRRSALAEAKELAGILRLLRSEQIGSTQDITPKIDVLAQKAADIREELREIEVKNTQYKAAAKYLIAYRQYLPVIDQCEKLRGKDRRSYEALHEGEIAALRHAISELDNLGVNTNVDPEKVLQLVRSQEIQASRLREDLQKIAAQMSELQVAKNIVNQVQAAEQQTETRTQSKKTTLS